MTTEPTQDGVPCPDPAAYDNGNCCGGKCFPAMTQTDAHVDPVRELLREAMLEQPVTSGRDTYGDGFANGLAFAIQQIDLAAARAMRAATAGGAVKVKPLVWSDTMPPDSKCPYHHVTAPSALGEFSIEWKGWKDHDGRCVYLNGDYLGSADDLPDAFAIAVDHLRTVITSALEPATATAQEGAAKAPTVEDLIAEEDDTISPGLQRAIDDTRSAIKAAFQPPIPALTMPVAHDPRFPSSGCSTKTVEGTLYNAAPTTPAPEPGSVEVLADLKARLLAGHVTKPGALGGCVTDVGAIEGAMLEAHDALTTLQQQLAAKDARIVELEATERSYAEMVIALDQAQNRATAAEAECAKLNTLFEALRDESWDLRCFDIPTGGGDADIGWRVVGHWQAEPRERVIAEVYKDDPAEAIRAALAAKSAGGGE